MIVPGETEAGSAGKQPCRGIPWWAHRDDDRSAAASLPRFKKHIGSVDPNDLRLDAYERQFGGAERLRLKVFEYEVRAEGVEAACVKQSLSPKRCEALERNRQALFADGDSTFARPSAQ